MIKPIFLPRLDKFIAHFGILPTSYKEAMTYEEQLLWICNYIEQTLIPALNTNTQAIEELQNLYVELKDYVDNYFDNLDVQNEINNKLDDMAENGELEDIIAAYLSTRALFMYDNVNSMTHAENLQAGNYAKTAGFYNPNDGGEAVYLIREVTNQDVVDSAFIIAMQNNELVAELLTTGEIKAEQIGIETSKANSHNTPKLRIALQKLNELGGGTIKFNGSYNIAPIEINYRIENITLQGIRGKTKLIKSSSQDTYLFRFTDSSSKITFKDMFIECNGTGGAISFENTVQSEVGRHGYITLENVDIRHANKALNMEATVYAHVNNCNISLSGTLESDDFGIQINGYEYNYFNDTSVQFWVDNITDAPNDIAAIKGDGVHVIYFNRCEVVKVNGYGFKFTSNTRNCDMVHITDCTIFNVNNPINFDRTEESLSNILISGNQIVNETSNKNIVFANTKGTAVVCPGIIVSNNCCNSNSILEIAENMTNTRQRLAYINNYASANAGYTTIQPHGNFVNLIGNSIPVEGSTTVTPTQADSYKQISIPFSQIPDVGNEINVIYNTNLQIPRVTVTKDSSNSQWLVRFYYNNATTSFEYTINYRVII